MCVCACRLSHTVLVLCHLRMVFSQCWILLLCIGVYKMVCDFLALAVKGEGKRFFCFYPLYICVYFSGRAGPAVRV